MRGFASGGGSGGCDMHGFFHKDNVIVPARFYQAGNLAIENPNDIVPVADKIYAYPVFFSRATTIT